MYLTMNRFRIRIGQEEAFETLWKTRDSHLTEVPGFISFDLMKGDEVAVEGEDSYRLYASHTLWESEAAFLGWTKSEAFRAAHRGAGGNGHLYLGHPKLELFASVQHIGA